MALISGADSASAPDAPSGTANPANLFQATHAASVFYCTQKKSNKKQPVAPINAATITAHTNMTAAAAAGNVAQMAALYADVEKAFVARFLQFSLFETYEASKPVSKAVLRKTDACRSPCLREAQQVPGRGGLAGGLAR